MIRFHLRSWLWSILAAGCLGAVAVAAPAAAPVSRFEPADAGGFFVLPAVEQALTWTTRAAEGAKIKYAVTDYAGRPVLSGVATAGADRRLTVPVRLPRGYYEIELDGERFGAVSMEPYAGTPDGFFGMDAALTWLERRPEMRRAMVNVLKRSGIGWARERMRWIGVNPAPDKWDWAEHDQARAVRGMYAAEGLTVLEMFHDPGPARGTYAVPSSFPQDLVQLSRSWPVIHETLKDTWGGLEVWNEPEGSSYGKGLPADQYVPMVKAMRWTFERQGVRAPLGGGVFIGTEPGDYHRFCARNGLLDHVDFVGFHDYRPAADMESVIASYRNWLRESGREGMPLWLTECGWPWDKGGGRPPPDQDRRSAMEIAMKGVEAKACGIVRYMPFCLAFYEEGGTKSFSLMGKEVTPLRSMAAYVQSVRALSGREYAGDLAVSGAARARVFVTPGNAAGGDAVAVLYTGKDEPVWIRFPVKPVRAEAIDGSLLAPAADGGVEVSGGMAYLWFAPDAATATLIRRDTGAMRLLTASRMPLPAATPAGPMVLQHVVEPGQGCYSPLRYMVDAATAAHLRIRVRVTNLSDREEPVRLTVAADTPAVTGAAPLGAGQEVTVPAQAAREVEWTVDAGAALDLVQTRGLTVRGTRAGGAALSPLALPYILEGSLDGVLQHFPRQERLDIGTLSRWETNIAGHGRMTMTAGEGGLWRLVTGFDKPGDRWVYPKFRIDAGTLAGAAGLVLRMRAENPAALRLMLFERNGGGGYWTADPILPADGKWHVVFIPVEQFGALGSHPDKANGTLDLAEVTAVAPGMNDGSKDLRNVLEISDLIVVGNAAVKTPVAAPAPAAAKPVPPATAAAPAMGSYRLENARLLEPFWRSPTVYGESALFVQEKTDAPATGTLLFKPAKILRVHNARTGELYEAGRDYEVDAAGRKLVRTSTSRIPFMKAEDFYKPKGAKQAIKQKADDPETWLLYQEQGFQDKQVEVDYVRSEDWQGYVPQSAGSLLKRVADKLRRKEKLTIAIIGDSISTGANASSKVNLPHMPPYTVLLARQLEAVYGGTVELLNVAKGGTMADGGLKEVPAVLAAKPDLVFIAYGANDVAIRNAAKYAENVGRIVDAVRAGAPDAEFILVTSSRAHPEWSWTPAAEFPKYRDALAKLAGEKHAALADMTLLWAQMLERKRFWDLTGNGVNHPNDFGHRLYAEVLLALLVNGNKMPAAPSSE